MSQEQANQLGTIWLALLFVALMAASEGDYAGQSPEEQLERAFEATTIGLSYVVAGEQGQRTWAPDQALWRTLTEEWGREREPAETVAAAPAGEPRGGAGMTRKERAQTALERIGARMLSREPVRHAANDDFDKPGGWRDAAEKIEALTEIGASMAWTIVHKLEEEQERGAK